MNKKIETVIVGGGQAGLSTSYHLKKQGRPHIVLERAAKAAPVWSEGRWDSFTLVTPNWTFKIPGAEYGGEHPEAFMTRDEVAEFFQGYAEKFMLPLQCRCSVTAVQAKSDGQGFEVHTDDTVFEADNVVMATGLFQSPRIPAYSREFPSSIKQLHSSEYRNPGALPAGGVLVVGSSQSGAQIAEELRRSGRQVSLCVGGAGRVPRRYRGKDSSEWQELLKLQERTVDMLSSPKMKFAANPHTAGKDGQSNINLHQFARDGIQLLGRLQGVTDGVAHLALDLRENLAKADKFERDFLGMIDKFIEYNHLDAPPEVRVALEDGYHVELVEALDLEALGISTVIWAVGYNFNFGLVKFPVFDRDGYPLQHRGVSTYPGLYFVGLPWLHTQKSGLLSGVGADAEYIVAAIVAREKASLLV